MDAIVCSSVGRSGLALLYKSISKEVVRKRFCFENNELIHVACNKSWTSICFAREKMRQSIDAPEEICVKAQLLYFYLHRRIEELPNIFFAGLAR